MSATRSPSTGLVYGVLRVCQAWDIPRSSYYAWRDDGEAVDEAVRRGRRGPSPSVPEDELLALIRKDLADSPFQGEGYKKVHHRLKRAGHRVSAKRVNRVMRENGLLSPHRTPKADPNPHDGQIITDAPNELWGTDGAKFLTVEEGWCWLFVAVEHWNSECMGWHVCKKGDRFAALQPIAQGVQRVFGSVGADVARGLGVRSDHGPQYRADDFRNQLRFWGAAPSMALVGEPETNGVAERFIRTVREQVLNGRVFRNLDEVRVAMAAFVERYNQEWLVEKLDYVSPLQARAQFFDRSLPLAA